MIVMKFGGSSVANKVQIDKVRAIVAARAARRPLVVSSAHKGITDALVAAARGAVGGQDTAAGVIARQRQVADELGCAPSLLEPLYEELSLLLKGVKLVRELSPRSLDYVSSFGERMAVRAIADYFTRAGLPARAFDAWELGFITDGNWGMARPLPGFEGEVRAAVAARAAGPEIPIVTGFIGKTPAGEITTVGRNGSDLTCTLFAAALAAEEAEIWSDTDGVMTADPNIVKQARNIPFMRFDEAAELAYFGSRVLHPSTLVPAMAQGIPVRVQNTNRPEHPGTVIEQAPPEHPAAATSIAYKERQVAVTITSPRMFGQAGFLGRVFEILGRHEVVVDLVATSEISLSFTTDRPQALEAALPELASHGSIEMAPDKTILVVVGRSLPQRPGQAAEILGAIGQAGINVEMISHARGSINLTLLLDDKDIGAVVPVLHRILFER